MQFLNGILVANSTCDSLPRLVPIPIRQFLALIPHFLIFTLSTLGSFKLPAQNLVNNPGFEQALVNPGYGGAGINRAPFWSKLDRTTDFFHDTYPDPYSIPENWRGKQDPAEGLGYAGIIATVNSEFLVIKLKETLTRDQIYNLSFKVSLSEQSKYGIDGLGAAVLMEEPLEKDLRNYQYTIRNRKGQAIVDTLGWTSIAGQFRAEGGEQYLLIGSLPEDDIKTSHDIGHIAPWAYYFIDDVYLAPCPKPVIVRHELDTSICTGAWVTLKGLNDANSHRWVNGGVSNSRVVQDAGVYILDNHYDCKVIQQIYQIESNECGCSISLPTLFHEGLSFPMTISPLVRKYDLIMINAAGTRVLPLFNQIIPIDGDRIPKASATYFWKARLTCINALDQPYHREISGKLIVQN